MLPSQKTKLLNRKPWNFSRPKCMCTYVWPDAVCVWVEKLAGKLEILTKNRCSPSPPSPSCPPHSKISKFSRKFAKYGAPWNLRGLWGGLWGDQGDYGADHGHYGADGRRSPPWPPFPLSKIDKWAILLGAKMQSLSQSLFFPADFCGPADCPALPHIGTLARLIIKYPAYQLLGKNFFWSNQLCCNFVISTVNGTSRATENRYEKRDIVQGNERKIMKYW